MRPLSSLHPFSFSSSLHTLPATLLMLLTTPSLALAQSRTLLPLNGVISLNTNKLPKTSSSSGSAISSFAIPQQPIDGPPLGISVALCSGSSGNSATTASTPRFFVTNASNWDTQDDPGPGSPGLQGSGKERDTWEIVLANGMGNWTGFFPNGGVLGVDLGAGGAGTGGAGVDFDVGVSENDPIHQSLSGLPLFGDTTANQALVFSAAFQALTDAQTQQPTYPNYTLPAANMSQSAIPQGVVVPNMTLVLSVTGNGNADDVGVRSACALDRVAAATTVGKVASQKVWARDDGQGWRMQWVMEGLTPATNYTAYVLTNSTKVSGPIYFATKSAAFTCPLVHSLPYCPSVAYAVPLPAPPRAQNAYTDASGALPASLTTPLLSYLANFTTVLTTHACGRDWYSPIMGCDDCQKAYRAWLCAVSFTRCSEASASSSSTSSSPSITPIVQPPSQNQNQAQLPLSALLPQQPRDTPRNPFLPSPASPYTALLPCIEQCYAVDRACPPFLGFKCPSSSFNAAASYGVGYVDGEDGDQGKGRTGVTQDRWGNVWCNYV